VGEAHVGRGADVGVGGEVGREECAALGGGGDGALLVGGEGLVGTDEGAGEGVHELGLGVEVDAADVEVMGLDLSGRGDDGLMALVVLVAGYAEAERAQPFELDVLAGVEVTGGCVGHSLHHALQVGNGVGGGFLNLLGQLAEGDGSRLDRLRIEPHGPWFVPRTAGKFLEIVCY